LEKTQLMKRERIFHAMGWASAALALLITAVIGLGHRQYRKEMAKSLRELNSHKLDSARSQVENYLGNIWMCLRLVSDDAQLAELDHASWEHRQTVYQAYVQHRLSEIYVIQRDFDDRHEPFMTFALDGGDAGRHTPERDAAEYVVQRDHLKRLAEDPTLQSLISDEIPLCAGYPGVVCSVPIRTNATLTGMVAGMLPSESISYILERSSLESLLLLVNEHGTLFGCAEFTREMQAWFAQQFRRHGVREFLARPDATQHFGPNTLLVQPVDLGDDQKWYLALMYTAPASASAGLFTGSAAEWGSAAIMLLLGGALVLVCRVIPALIEARRQADARARQLVEREALTRAIVDTAADGIITIDAQGTIASFNAAAERIFGYPAHEIIGQNLAILVPPPHTDRHGDYLTRRLASNGDHLKSSGLEMEGQRKDGSRVAIEVSVSQVYPADRRLFTGIIRDITDLKQAQEQVRRRQAELAHVMRLGTMGEMATSLAHELNQYHAAVLNYIDACAARVRSGHGDPAEILEDLGRAAGDAERAGEVIRRIRDFVRTREPRRARADINTLVSEAVDWLKGDARRGGVEVKLNPGQNIPAVMVDAVQIEQVIMNLMRNALEALDRTAAGPRTLTLQTALNDDGLIELAVGDSGPGLTAEAIDQVFEPFYTTKPEGMGMGLAISRTIVEAHGGRLEAVANPERGVTFRMTLPLVTAAVECNA
jgi:two-component system sensor kinase FixL